MWLGRSSILEWAVAPHAIACGDRGAQLLEARGVSLMRDQDCRLARLDDMRTVRTSIEATVLLRGSERSNLWPP